MSIVLSGFEEVLEESCSKRWSLQMYVLGIGEGLYTSPHARLQGGIADNETINTSAKEYRSILTFDTSILHHWDGSMKSHRLASASKFRLAG